MSLSQDAVIFIFSTTSVVRLWFTPASPAVSLGILCVS
jgi:hypothetical protein